MSFKLRINNPADVIQAIDAIEVRYYLPNGKLSESVVYKGVSITEIFNAIVSKGMDALAHPVGTTSGAYNYDPRKEGHTVEGFQRKLECCCNDPAEYYERLRRAGIV